MNADEIRAACERLRRHEFYQLMPRSEAMDLSVATQAALAYASLLSAATPPDAELLRRCAAVENGGIGDLPTFIAATRLCVLRGQALRELIRETEKLLARVDCHVGTALSAARKVVTP